MIVMELYFWLDLGQMSTVLSALFHSKMWLHGGTTNCLAAGGSLSEQSTMSAVLT